MKNTVFIAFFALFFANFAHAIDAKIVNSGAINPEQLQIFAEVMTHRDCAVWTGGEGYENDSVPTNVTIKLMTVFARLKDLSVPDALYVVDVHCKQVLAK